MLKVMRKSGGALFTNVQWFWMPSPQIMAAQPLAFITFWNQWIWPIKLGDLIKNILLTLNLNRAPSIKSILMACTNTLLSLLWTGIDFVFPKKHFLEWGDFLAELERGRFTCWRLEMVKGEKIVKALVPHLPSGQWQPTICLGFFPKLTI